MDGHTAWLETSKSDQACWLAPGVSIFIRSTVVYIEYFAWMLHEIGTRTGYNWDCEDKFQEKRERSLWRSWNAWPNIYTYIPRYDIRMFLCRNGIKPRKLLKHHFHLIYYFVLERITLLIANSHNFKSSYVSLLQRELIPKYQAKNMCILTLSLLAGFYYYDSL